MAKDLYTSASKAHSLARLLVTVIEPIEDDIAVNPEVDPMSRENITHVRRLTHALAEQLQQLEQQADELPEESSQ
jgi:hypothetical protein